MDKKQIETRLLQLGTVFTPTDPIMKRDFFYGRIKQIQQVYDAIQERGQHAVLFGERGVGKTSLANIINDSIPGVLISKVTCNRTEKFRDIWVKILKRVTFLSKYQGVGFTAVESVKAVQLDMFLFKGREYRFNIYFGNSRKLEQSCSFHF